MRRLLVALAHPPAKNLLLAKVFVLVVAVRLGLTLLPFRTMRRWVSRAVARSETENRPARDGVYAVSSLRWAVQVASQFVPGATCLTQALALQVMLARSGHQGEIHIGVGKDAAGKFQAHAWLANGDQILIGGVGVDRWTPLTTLEPDWP